jgi:hypothetical protein
VSYRVAFGTSAGNTTFRVVEPTPFATVEDAMRLMRSYKRQGLWTWIEDDQGNFVPVPGAKSERVRKGYPLRAHATKKTAISGRSVKKSPARLDREIAEVLSGGAAHTTKKTSTRPTPYRIKLTPSELKAVEFARGRYAWPDMLSAHAADDGSIAFTESEMWQWTDDVDSDAEGGHSPFPLAAGAFAEKLQSFYDERI